MIREKNINNPLLLEYPYPVLNLIKDKIPVLGLDIIDRRSS